MIHIILKLVTVFERHGIGYILEGGSALGAERHSGLIPWDDDFDISVHEDYENVLLNAAADDLCTYKNIILYILGDILGDYGVTKHRCKIYFSLN